MPAGGRDVRFLELQFPVVSQPSWFLELNSVSLLDQYVLLTDEFIQLQIC